MQAWLRANSRWTPFSNHKVNSQSSIPHHSFVPMHISANPLHQRTRWRLPHVDFVRLHKATSTFNGANRSTATATLRHFSVSFIGQSFRLALAHGSFCRGQHVLDRWSIHCARRYLVRCAITWARLVAHHSLDY